MIDINDWVLRQEPPTPRMPADWKPSAKDRKSGAIQLNAIKLVAKALARTKQEPHPEGWLAYLGMATTWLNDHMAEDRTEAVRLAAHRTKVAPARRREP